MPEVNGSDPRVGDGTHRFPGLLYLCDFPPAQAGGGAVLLDRLLAEYPPEKLVTIVGSVYWNQFSGSRRWGRSATRMVFPVTRKTGRWGTGQLKELLDWLLMPLPALLGVALARRAGSRVVLTVAHGHLFVAAALVSRLCGLPLVLVVHDDWVDGIARGKLLPRSLASQIFAFVVRTAAHIYVISPEMAVRLEREFDAEAEVQLPGTNAYTGCRHPTSSTGKPFRIVFSGTLSGGVVEGLRTLAALIPNLEVSGRGCELHVFAPLRPEEARLHGLEGSGVVLRGWIPQDELQSRLAEADLLFLPYTFNPDQTARTMQSFPSKLADYLAVGRPILIFGPPESTVVRYAREHGFASVVDRPDPSALANSVRSILESSEYGNDLAEQSLLTFAVNHDIREQRSDFEKVLWRLIGADRERAKTGGL